MRHVGAAVEQHARVGLGGNAGQHGGRIHHQVVSLIVEQQKVSQQHSQPLEQVTSLDVTCDHRHLDAALHRRIAQQPCHRRVGQHGFDAGDQMGIGAVLGDLDHHALERGVEGAAEEERHLADEGEQTGEEEVEVAARELRAVGRACGAHVALHHQLAFAQLGGKQAQLRPVFGVCGLELFDHTLGLVRIGVASTFEGITETVDQRVEILQAHQVCDQPAARVGNQIDVRALRQGVGEIQGVVDRTF